jgi:phosphate transport system substrate-binding protein
MVIGWIIGMHRPYKTLACTVLLLFSTPSVARTTVDEALPDYEKVSGISGNLSSIGSDTLANLMTLWAEEFKRTYPTVNIQIQAPGSSTAPTGLATHTVNLGPMSRLMKDTEVGSFEDRYGYKPTLIAVAIDSLAVFVHKDNPITGLTLKQIDAMFSETLACGAPEPVTRWGQVGLGGAWADRSLQLYGRNSVSGTYGYFKQHVLCNGDFKNNVNEQPGSASVVQAVSTSVNGIGYSGIGYTTPSVRAVPLSSGEGRPFVEPTPENTLSGSYPLARFLYIYLNKAPGQPIEPLTAEFLKMILSKQGQQIVVKDGYIPLPSRVAGRERAKILPPPEDGNAQ